MVRPTQLQLPSWEELLLPEEEPPGWSPEPRALWGSSDEGRQAETIWPAIQGIREGSSSVWWQSCALSLWTKPFWGRRLKKLVLWLPCPALPQAYRIRGQAEE